MAKVAKKVVKEKAPKSTTGQLTANSKITLNVKENPHREGSIAFKKFGKLSKGMTVESAVAAGVDTSYLRHMRDKVKAISFA